MEITITIASIFAFFLHLFGVLTGGLKGGSPPAPSSPSPAPLAPAFFIIGDSSIDTGNNNYLLTLARAHMLPYGRDFDTHKPTGRFCNGKVPTDFLALRLGLPYPPPYLGIGGSVEEMIQGVNYASAAAGILFPTGSDLGQHIFLAEQIQQIRDTFQEFKLTLGEAAATNIISKSVVYISIGNNEFIHFYMRNVSGVQTLYKPWEFSAMLATSMKQQIQNLYNENVRRVVVAGLAPIGCAPHYTTLHDNKECNKEMNNLISLFNYAMRYMVEQLRQEFNDVKVIFCDMFRASVDILANHERYGFVETKDACCKGPFNVCLPGFACNNATNYMWWDQFHPTDAVNGILADNMWSDLHMKDMCYPMNIRDMMKD